MKQHFRYGVLFVIDSPTDVIDHLGERMGKENFKAQLRKQGVFFLSSHDWRDTYRGVGSNPFGPAGFESLYLTSWLEKANLHFSVDDRFVGTGRLVLDAKNNIKEIGGSIQETFAVLDIRIMATVMIQDYHLDYIPFLMKYFSKRKLLAGPAMDDMPVSYPDVQLLSPGLDMVPKAKAVGRTYRLLVDPRKASVSYIESVAERFNKSEIFQLLKDSGVEFHDASADDLKVPELTDEVIDKAGEEVGHRNIQRALTSAGFEVDVNSLSVNSRSFRVYVRDSVNRSLKLTIDVVSWLTSFNTEAGEDATVTQTGPDVREFVDNIIRTAAPSVTDANVTINSDHLTLKSPNLYGTFTISKPPVGDICISRRMIREKLLAAGYKLKDQGDGKMELNPYVYQGMLSVLDHLFRMMNIQFRDVVILEDDNDPTLMWLDQAKAKLNPPA